MPRLLHREREDDMTSRCLDQNKMNHLARLTNLTASFYDLIFKTFWLGRENDFRQRVVKLMNLADGESVLDIGCGTGTLTTMIANEMNGKGSILGVDLAPRMIEKARKKAQGQGKQIDYRVASSLALPFDNEAFDVVVTSLMHHQLMSWDERVKTVIEVRRVLKPGGTYVAAEFARFTLGNLLITHDSLIRRIPLLRPELLKENGFHVMEKKETSRGIMITLARK